MKVVHLLSLHCFQAVSLNITYLIQTLEDKGFVKKYLELIITEHHCKPRSSDLC